MTLIVLEPHRPQQMSNSNLLNMMINAMADKHAAISFTHLDKPDFPRPSESLSGTPVKVTIVTIVTIVTCYYKLL